MSKNIIIKPIYDKMLKGFISDSINHIECVKSEYNQLLDVKIEVDLLVETIKNITSDESIDPNDKYILINTEVDKVQKKTKVIADLNRSKSERELKLNRNKKILVETIIQNHTGLTENDIIEYIGNKIDKKSV